MILFPLTTSSFARHNWIGNKTVRVDIFFRWVADNRSVSPLHQSSKTRFTSSTSGRVFSQRPKLNEIKENHKKRTNPSMECRHVWTNKWTVDQFRVAKKWLIIFDILPKFHRFKHFADRRLQKSEQIFAAHLCRKKAKCFDWVICTQIGDWLKNAAPRSRWGRTAKLILTIDLFQKEFRHSIGIFNTTVVRNAFVNFARGPKQTSYPKTDLKQIIY